MLAGVAPLFSSSAGIVRRRAQRPTVAVSVRLASDDGAAAAATGTETAADPGLDSDPDLDADPPAPFHQLLLHPARASWRSTSRPPPPHLSDVRSDLLRRSGRTGGQLRRTQDRIVSSHAALSERRERERRRLVNARHERDRPDSLRNKARAAADSRVRPVSYGPEQAAANLRYRLVPNYFVTRRVLDEARSLLGWRDGDDDDGDGDGGGGGGGRPPRRIIDAGCGVGSASAAALDLFGPHKVDWVHCVDPSRSMRDGCLAVLEGVVDGVAEADADEVNNEEDVAFDDAGGAISRRSRSSCRAAALAGGGRRRRTRITTGETIGEGVGGGSTGTFDLALCAYTASELPHVASTLAMAAVLWEKLAPDGVLVVIEPGTPDGFSTVRAVRNMLLDCCPPDDRHAAGLDAGGDDEEDGYDGRRRDGDEECHVIAPCTHNGSCPMERHRKDHLAKKFDLPGGKGVDPEHAAALFPVDEEWGDEIDFYDDDDDDITDDFDPESHPDWAEDHAEEDLDWEDASGTFKGGNKESVAAAAASASARSERPSGPKSPTKQTDVFERAFCSFVHSMPGGDARSKGEKFSYLVLQKRIHGGDGPSERERDEERNPFYGSPDVADLLAASLDAARETSANQNEGGQKKKHLRTVGDSTRHADVLRAALDLEDAYLDSDADGLALELVRGDAARRKYGRIVRAPIKRKGHVMVDYCAGGGRAAMGDDESDGHDGVGAVAGGDGRIVRHRVTRKVSARVAPGMYGAARKARWGGLWPDVSNRSGDW